MATENEVIQRQKEKSKEPSFQAYQILRFTFAVTPILAGIDKFFNFLTDWELYLASSFNFLENAQATMMVMGVIEIIIGMGIWIKPKFFAYISVLWLLGITINLLVLQKFYNIALRDLSLLLGALALARLSSEYDVKN